MPADRRPLPLVTADGPLCQAACGLRHTIGPALAMPSGTVLTYQCEAPGGGVVTDASPCHHDEHAAWLREQRRKLEVCGRCGHWGDMHLTTRDGESAWCRGFGVEIRTGPDESCSRFEERKDG